MSRTFPLISVIIPIHNNEVTIEKCLRSVVNQTYRNKEIIIIDDASSDNTINIVKKVSNQSSDIKIYSNIGSGIANARNRGVAVSKGEYISFVDSDDTVNDDYLSYLFTLANRSHTKMSSCQHKIVRFSKVDDKRIDEIPKVINSHDWIEDVLARKTLDLSTWGKLYKKELFENVSFPADKLFEDTSTTYKLVMSSRKIAIGNESKYNYVIRNNSITTSPFNVKKIDLIEATNEMVNDVLKSYPDLYDVSRLRITWAEISVLNSILLSNEGKKYTSLSKELTKEILDNRGYALSRKNPDKRLKFVVITLTAGLKNYKMFLNLFRKNLYKVRLRKL